VWLILLQILYSGINNCDKYVILLLSRLPARTNSVGYLGSSSSSSKEGFTFVNQLTKMFTSSVGNIKLEYLAVYGRASMAAFRQFSTHGHKFDPESLYEPI